MSTFENEPQSLLRSLMIVVETFTTIGFGTDAPWTSGQMQLLMIVMALTSVGLVFLALPVFVAPWVERRLGRSVPTATDKTDHVVLCGHSSRGETLIDELASWDREYVIVESDHDRARRLLEHGYDVVHGDPESVETLAAAGVCDAEVVVVDTTDELNASVILSIREQSDDVRIVAVVEEPEMTEYLSYAGADQVYSPRELLGESLANEVTAAISTELGDTVAIGDDFELVELPVQTESSIAGSTLAESGIRERTGADVVGIWEAGQFHASPAPEHRITADTRLLVAGTESQLAALKRQTLTDVVNRVRGDVIVGGHGEVGEVVRRRLARSRMTATVVDREPDPTVDVVGDVTDRSTLEAAEIEDADALVLALGDDTATMLATLVARELNPTLRIVARVDEAENVGKVSRAGADYVLALGTVSGRMIASGVLEEDVLAPEARVEIIRTTAPALTGQTLEGADIGARTGCVVLAVERDGELNTDLNPDFAIESSDQLIVAGSDEGVNRFTELARHADSE